MWTQSLRRTRARVVLSVTCFASTVAACGALIETSEEPAEVGPDEEAGVASDVRVAADTGNPTDAGEDDSLVPFVVDTFSRTLESGLGEADLGGTWTVSQPAFAAIEEGKARITIPRAGSGFNAYLPKVSASDADLQVTFASEKGRSGTYGLYLRAVPRWVTKEQQYGCLMLVQPDGRIRQTLFRKTADAGGKDLIIMNHDRTFEPNAEYRLRMQVIGQDPTTLRAKVWNTTDPEPQDWELTIADSTPELQRDGTIGMEFYLSNGATNAPLTISVDDLSARPVQSSP